MSTERTINPSIDDDGARTSRTGLFLCLFLSFWSFLFFVFYYPLWVLCCVRFRCDMLQHRNQYIFHSQQQHTELGWKLPFHWWWWSFALRAHSSFLVCLLHTQKTYTCTVQVIQQEIDAGPVLLLLTFFFSHLAARKRIKGYRTKHWQHQIRSMKYTWGLRTYIYLHPKCVGAQIVQTRVVNISKPSPLPLLLPSLLREKGKLRAQCISIRFGIRVHGIAVKFHGIIRIHIKHNDARALSKIKWNHL